MKYQLIVCERLLSTYQHKILLNPVISHVDPPWKCFIYIFGCLKYIPTTPMLSHMLRVLGTRSPQIDHMTNL
jgi:hypothetical protein